jgi:hypothetical protein
MQKGSYPWVMRTRLKIGSLLFPSAFAHCVSLSNQTVNLCASCALAKNIDVRVTTKVSERLAFLKKKSDEIAFFSART